MQEIYCLIGEIVEISQVIEYNLALTIKYNEYINFYKSKKNNDVETFEKEVGSLHKEMSTFTLGQLIHKVKEVDIFTSASIDKLFKLLSFRNELVHNYFKVNNFSILERFSTQYRKIIENLSENLTNMQMINKKLCEIIKSQQIEFSNLYKA